MWNKNLCIALSAISFLCLVFLAVIQHKTGINSLADKREVVSEIISPENGCLAGDEVFENYCVVSPFDDDDRNSKDMGLVTLCTQSTVAVEYLNHVTVQCSRWGGPMSVAVYAPLDDYANALAHIGNMRDCDFCVRNWVRWHFFFRKEHTPKNFATTAPRPVDDCSTLLSFKINPVGRNTVGPYPINVGRNIARSRTSTQFVFSLDIELYPSPGVLPKFERMMRTKRNILSERPRVWVLPVFEVVSNVRAPATKFMLKKLYNAKQAISFHKYRCNECHRIPDLQQWLNTASQSKPDLNETLDSLRIWRTVQRDRKHGLSVWEPFFIGTTNDPEFDIHLSWEGKQNKMQMAYEMCLREYDFHIVENAFLVHSSGINFFNATKERYRLKYQKENSRWMSAIRKKLFSVYGHKQHCLPQR